MLFFIFTAALYPLELIKTRMQVEESRNGTYRSISSSLRIVLKKEGFKGLYQGRSVSYIFLEKNNIPCPVTLKIVPLSSEAVLKNLESRITSWRIYLHHHSVSTLLTITNLHTYFIVQRLHFAFITSSPLDLVVLSNIMCICDCSTRPDPSYHRCVCLLGRVLLLLREREEEKTR